MLAFNTLADVMVLEICHNVEILKYFDVFSADQMHFVELFRGNLYFSYCHSHVMLLLMLANKWWYANVSFCGMFTYCFTLTYGLISIEIFCFNCLNWCLLIGKQWHDNLSFSCVFTTQLDDIFLVLAISRASYPEQFGLLHFLNNFPTLVLKCVTNPSLKFSMSFVLFFLNYSINRDTMDCR